VVVGDYFPFVHFISLVVIPFMYWVACIELGVYNSNENQFTLTFGQVSVLPNSAGSNHPIRNNARSLRFSWPSLRSSKCANSHPAYSSGSTILRGSAELTVIVASHGPLH